MIDLEKLNNDFLQFKKQEIEAHGTIMEAMDTITNEIKRLNLKIENVQTTVVNGGREQKKQFRWADAFILLLTASMAIIGYFYIDDREVMRIVHARFAEALREVSQTVTRSVTTLHEVKIQNERDHRRFEVDLEKLQPDRPRFDYQDHEDAHHRWGDKIP
jgi:hypothetical protein